MSARFLIKGGRVLDPASGTDAIYDVLIEGDSVADMGQLGSISGVDIIDATDKWVLPGLVDIHVHLREPGEEYKEDIATGSAAAAAGGFTTIVAMPNTRPVVDNAEVTGFVLARGKACGKARVLPAGAVTVGQKGEQLAPFGELKKAGAVALTDDGHPVVSAGLFRSALEYARDFGMVVLTHAEEPTLSRGGFMHEGAVATRLGLKGVPRMAEDVAVARDIMLAEYTGGRLHICHVSTAGAVELVRRAKARGVRVSAEAAPHHFTLTDEAVALYDTRAKMNPPLREEADRQALIAGLADGTIDAIATDHAPHSSLEKDTTFDEAHNGVIGLQTALPLALDLWRQGALSPLSLCERLTLGPARALGLAVGRLQKGSTADVTIVDPDVAWQLDESSILSKSKNSPFLQRSLRGRAEVTILAGVVTHRIV